LAAVEGTQMGGTAGARGADRRAADPADAGGSGRAGADDVGHGPWGPAAADQRRGAAAPAVRQARTPARPRAGGLDAAPQPADFGRAVPGHPADEPVGPPAAADGAG